MSVDLEPSSTQFTRGLRISCPSDLVLADGHRSPTNGTRLPPLAFPGGEGRVAFLRTSFSCSTVFTRLRGRRSSSRSSEALAPAAVDPRRGGPSSEATAAGRAPPRAAGSSGPTRCGRARRPPAGTARGMLSDPS